MGERTKGFQWFDTGTVTRHGGGLECVEESFGSSEGHSPVRHRRVGAKRVWTLERKLSPWKDRVAGRWQRRLVTTDSSAEQSLEVGCFVRFGRALTSAHFGECGRSAMETPSLGWGLEQHPSGCGESVLRSDYEGQARLRGGLIAKKASALRHRHHRSDFTRWGRKPRFPVATCAR